MTGVPHPSQAFLGSGVGFGVAAAGTWGGGRMALVLSAPTDGSPSENWNPASSCFTQAPWAAQPRPRPLAASHLSPCVGKQVRPV